jgi:hypothetical protein
MTPNAHKTETQQDAQPNLDALPESLRRWCLSGKSVQDMAHLVKNALQITSGCAEIIELGLKRKQFDRVERSWELFEPNFLRLKNFKNLNAASIRLRPMQSGPVKVF